MTTKRQFDYKIGDRVAERPKTHGVFATSKEAHARIKQYRNQRYGTIVGFNTKKNSRGAEMKLLLVKWDHLTSPSEHAQMRLCPASELDKLAMNTLVPGE